MGRAQYPVPGTLKGVQRGVILITTGDNAQDATISAVDMSKAELRFLGARNNSSSAFIGTDWPAVELTNSTTITAMRNSGSTPQVYVHWELTESY